MAKATTIRFSDEVFARLDQASAQTGMPVNSIVVAACLEWMQRHTLAPTESTESLRRVPIGIPRPRWATLRRAVKLAAADQLPTPPYPFERFTKTAQKMLTTAQSEALKSHNSYIGTEHLLLAAFADPSSLSARLLGNLGVREETVRFLIDRAIGGKVQPAAAQIIPTSRVKKVIELAFTLCGAAGEANVSTAHILLALASEGHGIAAHVLKDTGAGRDRIESAMDGLTEPEI